MVDPTAGPGRTGSPSVSTPGGVIRGGLGGGPNSNPVGGGGGGGVGGSTPGANPGAGPQGGRDGDGGTPRTRTGIEPGDLMTPRTGRVRGFVPIGRRADPGAVIPTDRADYASPVFNTGTNSLDSTRFSEHYADNGGSTTINNYYYENNYYENNTYITNNYYGGRRGYGRGGWGGWGRWDDCDGFRPWYRDRWSVSISFNFGSSVGYWYRPAYCPPVWYVTPRWYHYEPCFDDWYAVPSFSLSFRYRSTRSFVSVGYTSSASTYYCSPWSTQTVTYWSYVPRCEPTFFTWDWWPTSGPVVHTVYVPAPVVTTPVYFDVTPTPPPTLSWSAQPTYFEASDIGGVLNFDETPLTLVAELRSVFGDDRAAAAGEILGRTPAVPWDVVFEGVQERKLGSGELVRELRARSIAVDVNGFSPTIILRGYNGATPALLRQGLLTGRLSQICVDDPAYPGGYILLEDGAVKW